MRILTTILLFLAPTLALASSQDYSGTPLSPYISASNGDKALDILGQILGNMGGMLPGGSSPLAAMMDVFNTSIAAVGVILLVYSLTAGIVQTAHDGEFLGKRYSSLWMPIRTVIGVTSVLPVVNGWALSQLVMVWAAKVGIGIANLVWAAGIGAMLSINNNVVTPQAATQDAAIKGILKAETCMIGQNKMLDDSGMPTSQHFTMKVKSDYAILAGIGLNTPDRYAILFGGDGSHYPEDACGGVSVPIMGSLFKAIGNTVEGGQSSQMVSTGQIVRAHGEALQTMATSLMPIAQQIVDGQTPDPALLAQIDKAYVDQVTQTIAGEVQVADNALANFIHSDGESWAYAGSIYQKIASINRDIIDAAALKANVIDPTEGTADSTGNIMNDGIELGSNRYAGYMQRIQQSTGGQGGNSGILDRLFGGSVISPLMNGAFQIMTLGDTNPMTAMTNLGYTLVSGGVAAITTATMTAGEIETAAGSKILGTGIGQPTGTITATLGLVDMILLSVIGVGLYYCAFLPFIPFLEWFGAMVAYVIIVIEGVVGAVLWSIAHLEAEGEGLPDKSMHGYLFVLNVILRPSLMLIGLVAGGLMLTAMGSFLQIGLSILFGSNNPYPGIASLLLFIASLMIMAVMMNGLIHRSFALIHILPDKIISWIGGNFGSSGNLDHDGKQTFMAAVASIKNATTQTQPGIGSAEKIIPGSGRYLPPSSDTTKEEPK